MRSHKNISAIEKKALIIHFYQMLDRLVKYKKKDKPFCNVLIYIINAL